jgi:hypothetical protein
MAVTALSDFPTKDLSIESRGHVDLDSRNLDIADLAVFKRRTLIVFHGVVSFSLKNRVRWKWPGGRRQRAEVSDHHDER